MRARPAFLQFDGSKVWICQPLYNPIQRLASNFVQDREDIGQLFMWLQIFYFKPRREKLTGLLFCLDLSLSRSTDLRDRNLHSLSLEVRPATLSFHLSVNMCF